MPLSLARGRSATFKTSVTGAAVNGRVVNRVAVIAVTFFGKTDEQIHSKLKESYKGKPGKGSP